MPLLMGATMLGMALLYFRYWQQEPTVASEATTVTVASQNEAAANASAPSSSKEKSSESDLTRSISSPEELPEIAVPPVAILPPTEADFTPWMSQLALRTYILQKNRGNTVSYWDAGHWIRAVEGRWDRGDVEYRIALGQMERSHEFEWQHRIDLTEADFAKEGAALQGEGYRLIQSQSYSRPDGSLRTQAVWRRDGLLSHENPSPIPEKRPNVVGQTR